MGIADDGGSDQDEDAGADDRADAERGQIPGREGFFQTMIGMICVREDLFNGLGSEESADHRISSGRGDGEERCRVTEFLFHMGSSIAGLFRWSRIARMSRVTVCGAGGAQKGLEQSPMERVPIEEKFRVPLDAEKEAVGRRFDRLHDTIGGQGAGDQ